MDGEFVKELQNIITQGDANNSLDQEKAVALPDTYHIEDLERFQDQRRRFRGTFRTQHIDSFVGYFPPSRDACFVDTNTMRAVAFFDMGHVDAPGHCEHRAELALVQTAEFRAFMDAATGGPMGQRELAEFLEDWRTNVEALDGEGEVIPIAKVIQTIRNVKIDASKSMASEEQDFSAAKSFLEKIDAKGQDGDFPKYLTFGCVPYDGLSAREFAFRLSIRTEGSSVRFLIRRICPEKDQEAMAEEFANILETKIGDDILLGEFKP